MRSPPLAACAIPGTANAAIPTAHKIVATARAAENPLFTSVKELSINMVPFGIKNSGESGHATSTFKLIPVIRELIGTKYVP
jgi:hypothetical protein